MTISDNTYLSTLQNAGDVPGAASQALADPTWAWLYEVWAQEPRVDYVTQFMAQLARMTVDPNVSYNQLRMEAYTGQRVELYSSRTNQAFDLLNEDDIRRLLGLPTSASAGEVRGRLADRVLSKTNGHPHDNFGLMCGCGG